MGDDDRRDGEPTHDVEHLVTVGAAVQAVVVLHKRNVAVAEGAHRLRQGGRGTVVQLS